MGGLRGATRAIALLAAAFAAGDEPIYTLRLATLAPQGTGWAREMQAFSRDVALATNGQVALKWYLGGIAGDDAEAANRIARDQLDGMAPGPWQCERWRPAVTAP